MYADHLTQAGTLQQGTDSRTTSGELVKTWATVRSLRCLVQLFPRTYYGERRADSGIGIISEPTHLIFAEYATDVGSSGNHRVLVDGIAYLVLEAHDPANRHHHLELRCRRVEG